MKTKIITGYWMDCEGYPFQGANEVRKDRYLGSIKAHCENIGLPIICYTHKKNYNELILLKNTYNLENLEIKILELYDMKLHNKISVVRDKHFDTGLNGRGTEILWGKMEVLEKEINDCDQIYWIDAGLQHPGIFPWRFSKKYNKISDHKNTIPNWWTEYDVYNFKNIINNNLFLKIFDITQTKMLFLTSNAPQTSYPIDNITSPYPIGGFFGGNCEIVKEFINYYWHIADILLKKEHLCTEESIMKLCYDNLSINDKINFVFDVHATSNHDTYHFQEWNKLKDPKPLYMVWFDIINY